MARLLSRVECLAFDLLTTESLRLSLRQSKDTLSPGAVKDPLTRVVVQKKCHPSNCSEKVSPPSCMAKSEDGHEALGGQPPTTATS